MTKTVTARAPLRLNFAGGFTEVREYLERFGGTSITATINIYSRARIVERNDDVVRVLNEKLGLDVAGKLSEMDSIPEFYRVAIKEFSPKKGFDLILDSDVMYGSGLGSSSSTMASVIGALNEWLGSGLGKSEMAELICRLERDELGIYGGKQDPYCAVFGGLNHMEFHKDGHVTVERLALPDGAMADLESRILTVNTGIPRTKTTQIKEVMDKVVNGDKTTIDRLHSIKLCAKEMKNSLEKGQLNDMGRLMGEDWANKRTLAEGITSDKIDSLFDVAMRNGAEGGKLLGAGWGGHIVLAINPDKKQQLIDALTREGVSVHAPKFVHTGLEVTREGD